jgi:uncharacterized protein (TIGR00369 family)
MDWHNILDSALEKNIKNGETPLKSPIFENLGLPGLKSWEPGSVRAEWTVDPRMLNSRGELMGGFYGVLADAVLALSAMTVLNKDEFFKTSDLRVSFFRPILKGVIKIKGSVINKSKSMIHLEAVFKNDQGKLLSKATATQSIVSI